MILRYLKWTGFECKVFNVGNYRRKVGLAAANSDFFDASNPNNHKIREHLAMTVQESMYNWLHELEGESDKRRVAIFDATNTTKDRRLALQQRARKENVFLLFVESICDDENVLRRNYELKLKNDDYKVRGGGVDVYVPACY
jgi:6-phosphofructo-2-kinase / fructose-2,6-biphosphatase 2